MMMLRVRFELKPAAAMAAAGRGLGGAGGNWTGNDALCSPHHVLHTDVGHVAVDDCPRVHALILSAVTGQLLRGKVGG